MPRNRIRPRDNRMVGSSHRLRFRVTPTPRTCSKMAAASSEVGGLSLVAVGGSEHLPCGWHSAIFMRTSAAVRYNNYIEECQWRRSKIEMRKCKEYARNAQQSCSTGPEYAMNASVRSRWRSNESAAQGRQQEHASESNALNLGLTTRVVQTASSRRLQARRRVQRSAHRWGHEA